MKMKEKKGINNNHKKSSSEHKNKYLIKEKYLPELSNLIIIKTEELKLQNERLKAEKSAIDSIDKKLKSELSEYIKINKHLLSIEKEIEEIDINIAKINKKKLYNMSSMIRVKNFFKSSNLSKKYLLLLNSGLNNKQMNLEYFDLIIDSSENDFYDYLNHLERHYKVLEKENKNEFFNYKKSINDYLEKDNIYYPNDKLLLYLNYIFKNIELSNKLKEKKYFLNGIEQKKNSIDIKIRKLEMEKSEKESLIKEIKDYIELLKDILDKLLNLLNLNNGTLNIKIKI